jgi:uncharacterized protein YbjT (DUF2867 family)
MKNVIITGASGMIGGLVLDMCLNDSEVEKVTSIVRRTSGKTHPKLLEVVHTNFLDYSDITGHLKNQDTCFFCIGVYTGAVPNEEFRKITVDFTEAFAKVLRENSDKTTFCFLSGQGADRTEKSRTMFARDKGAAENILLGLGFENTYLFRPGYIYPSTPRKEPNATYKLMRWLYKPVLSKLYPNIGIPSEDLAAAMVETGLHSGDKSTLENRDIRTIAANLKSV